MADVAVELDVLASVVAVCRLPAGAPVPDWVELSGGGLVSVTRTRHELSIVVDQEAVPTGTVARRGWRVLAVRGPLAFSMTGVLAGLAGPLAEAGVPIFVVSTYDTDLLLVDHDRLEPAVAVLEAAGHTVHGAG